MAITPELSQIIDDAIETYARDRIHTSMPGQIVKVYEGSNVSFRRACVTGVSA